MNQLVPIASTRALPSLIAAAGERASLRFLEFFAANIRNPHTRRAYSRAVMTPLRRRMTEDMTMRNFSPYTSLYRTRTKYPRSRPKS